MGLYPSQTALVIRCCVQEREQTTDLFADTSDEGETKKEEPSYAHAGAAAPAIHQHAHHAADRRAFIRLKKEG